MTIYVIITHKIGQARTFSNCTESTQDSKHEGKEAKNYENHWN